jgi:nucleoside-diphosphate-sugar epimerase
VDDQERLMFQVAALTGATGFIGGAIARRMTAAGWHVRALVRPKSSMCDQGGPNIEWITGTLEETNALHRLVRDASVIVHCAGTVRGASKSYFDLVNIDGVARLVQAAEDEHHVPRFLLMSSLAAREPGLSPYAASKHGGEAVLHERANKLSWVTLRPPAVYGPGDREMAALFQWMGRGCAPMFVPEGARFSLLYIEDLVDAVLRLLGTKSLKNRIFEIHDGQPNGYSWDDIVDTVSRLTYRHIRRVSVPAFFIDVLATLNLLAARATGYKPILTPWKVREFRHPDWVGDNTALSHETGWTPTIGLAEGLKRTFGWGADFAKPVGKKR